MAKIKHPRLDRNFNAKLAEEYGFHIEKSTDTERYISPNQAARILNVTGEAIKQWIYRRRLPAIKLSNGYWKIRVRDLEEFIKARQNTGRRRILIVDPNSPPQDLIQTIQEMGHEPIITHGVSDALLKAVDLMPSLFLIHVTNEHEEVWNYIMRIRKQGNLKRLPILLIADTDLSEQNSMRAIDLEVQGLLKMPVSPQTIRDEIKHNLTRVM